MSTETFRWPPLESNPEVFTDYMRGVGLTAEWAINELYGFDEDLLGMLPQPVMAVIANVERLAKADDRQRGCGVFTFLARWGRRRVRCRSVRLPPLGLGGLIRPIEMTSERRFKNASK